MSTSLHPQNVVALIWDFDKTLIPGYMQDPVFEFYGLDSKSFWKEVNQLTKIYERSGIRVHSDTVYLNHFLTYVQKGVFSGLTNQRLRELGARIVFYEGVIELFQRLRESVADLPFEIRVEHYIVSTGLRAMIEGSAIRPHVEGIWASEFIEEPAVPGFKEDFVPSREHPISQIAMAYDNTSKTRALFEINKGSNMTPEVDVNAFMAGEDRRVPFSNMIYIADGPSDVPAFSLIRKNGGSAFAVYDERVDASFQQAERLRSDGRLDHYGPADYRPGGMTSRWLLHRVRYIAERMVADKQTAFSIRVGQAPRHLSF